MNYESNERSFGWPSCLMLAAFAIFFLPMSPGSAPEAALQAQAPKVAVDAPTFPRIVASEPKMGATGVDPGLKEISVTFDRDMATGMSWTGGPPHFPPVDKSREARWTDTRTCVLPVKLEKGSYYRLGINSTSHRNFRSRDGVSAPPTTLHFTTAGASKEIEQRVQAPAIVEIEPANGAKDVDPKTKALRVTFNMKMGEGMSWTGGGQLFPKLPDGEKPRWSADGKTCTLPVMLEPDHDYRLGLNSPSHINFHSQWGVPLPPVIYQFRTRGSE
jgi:RNA polymerase sigma-70 factor (ECF subfamily)